MSPVTLKTALVRASTVMAGARAGRPGRRYLVPLALLLAAPLALAGCGTAAKPAAGPAATFGGYPSYLPKDTLNYHDQVYRPVFVPGQPTPPTVLRPGQKVSFELRAVEAVGEGLMRWAPDGRNIVAKWDFVVEND